MLLNNDLVHLDRNQHGFACDEQWLISFKGILISELGRQMIPLSRLAFKSVSLLMKRSILQALSRKRKKRY